VFCITSLLSSGSLKQKTIKQGVKISHRLVNGWMQKDFRSLLAPPPTPFINKKLGDNTVEDNNTILSRFL